MIEVHDVILLKEAVDDLNAGEQFYQKKEYGLGDRFYNSLLDDLDQLYLYAGIHFKQFGLYRLLSRKFPYAVYYQIQEHLVHVIAILPLRRNPKWIENQIQFRLD